jgi:hypothetical protein
VEGVFGLQEILKLVFILNIRAPKKKVVVVINKYEEGEKLKKIGWMMKYCWR